MEVRSDNGANTNEMDLLEFIKGGWEQRWLIVIVAGLVTLIACGYALLASPVYEARAYILPPSKYDLEKFDFGGVKKSKLKHYSVDDVYGEYVSNLQSESLRRGFFDEYLSSSSDKNSENSSKQSLYRKLSRGMTVQADRSFPGRYSVVVSSDNSSKTADFLNKYLDYVSDATKEKFIKDFSDEARTRRLRVEARIKFLREDAAAKREDTLFRLREAEKVAGAAGFEKPLIVLDSVIVQPTDLNDPRMIYLRGTKALAAEVKVLEARVSDDPYIDGMRKLQRKSLFYKNLNVSPQDFAVYRIDGEIVSTDSPAKPNRALIIALGVVLGLSLGVVCGLARQFWIRGKRSR